MAGRITVGSMRVGGSRAAAAGVGLATLLLGCGVAVASSPPPLRDVVDQILAAPPVATPDEDALKDPLKRDVPRTAMKGFLTAARQGDYAKAGEYLDLRRMPKSERDPTRLARHLRTVLDRELWVDLDALSMDPAGKADDGLPPDRDRVGRIKTSEGAVDVLLQRVKDATGNRIWQISPVTVAAIPDLYAEFGHGALGDLLPEFFFELRALQIQLWQWIALALLALGAYLIALILTGLTLRILGPVVRRTPTRVDDRLLDMARGPLRLAIAVAVFSAGTLPIGLALPVRSVLAALQTIGVVVAVTWITLRLLDVLGQAAAEGLQRRGQVSAVALIPPLRRTAKIVVATVAFMAALSNLGFDVTALIAGVGIGGIALALAAQKSIENLFGGVTLYVDQAVRVGDFCRFGDRVGTVEEIGLRSTRVRTLDRTVVSVPNAEFANLQLENFAKRDKIRFAPRLGLRYETSAEQLRYVLVELRALLYAHPRVDNDPARVRFVGFGPYSLDIDVLAYVLATDYGDFLEVAEDLNLRIIDIVQRAGSSFAFPSQTVYVESGKGLEADRAQEAEREVQRWRERHALFLPRFTNQRIAELSGTLAYPADGSPHAGNANSRPS